jgi:hypothetical protein
MTATAQASTGIPDVDKLCVVNLAKLFFKQLSIAMKAELDGI